MYEIGEVSFSWSFFSISEKHIHGTLVPNVVGWRVGALGPEVMLVLGN